jgi:hypothetical protein
MPALGTLRADLSPIDGGAFVFNHEPRGYGCPFCRLVAGSTMSGRSTPGAERLRTYFALAEPAPE